MDRNQPELVEAVPSVPPVSEAKMSAPTLPLTFVCTLRFSLQQFSAVECRGV